MKYAWDMMLAVSTIEDDILLLKKLTCDGSMLKGHTINAEKATANYEQVMGRLKHMRLAVESAMTHAEADK